MLVVLAKLGASSAIGLEADRNPTEEGPLMPAGSLPDDYRELCLCCAHMVLENSEVSDDVLPILLQTEEIGDRAVKCHDFRGLLCPLGEAADICDAHAPGWAYNPVKRGIDILGGLVGSAIAVILLPLIAAIIKAQSPGPIFFAQERVGLNGKTFRLYKFRTMHEKTGDEARWANQEEDRIFGFGAFMRRFHIDEFPQFFNVLGGSMSLVGPRPEQVLIVERLSLKIPNFDKRHCVLPGLTGWSQMRHGYAGCELTSWLKTASDLYYIKHRTLLFDAAILLRTIPAVLIKEQVAYRNNEMPEGEAQSKSAYEHGV